MVEQRGLVIHIAEGSYEGTISWSKTSSGAKAVSTHFVLDYDGKLAQVVDTRDAAWTQQAGNGHWLSVECAGFTPGALTPAQVESVARLLAKAHQIYQVPLQVATSPDGRGLGHHSMGTDGGSVPTDTWTGPTWGHENCPGPAIINQKPLIVTRAKQLLGDDMPTPAEMWNYLISAVDIHDDNDLPNGYTQPAAEFLKWIVNDHNLLVEMKATLARIEETLEELADSPGGPTPAHTHDVPMTETGDAIWT
jgi:N-acetylmuramoyl-L-alanine amidase